MIRILLGIFLILHGVVHGLYFGQSKRFFEMAPGLTWPDHAWAFDKLFGTQGTRNVVGVLLILAAVGFITSGVLLLVNADWWRTLTILSAVFSSLIYLLSFDGVWVNLDQKGLVGILINLALAAAAVWVKQL